MELQSHLQIIEKHAFDACTKLKNLKIPSDSNLRSIGEFLFRGVNIENLTIPSNVTEISRCAFCNCEELKTVTFPQNLQTIEDSAFENTALESITIPATVTKIGSDCFLYCRYLKTVIFAENSQSQLIDYHAFYASRVESINIPSNAILGTSCLNNFDHLQNITISPYNQNYRYIDNKYIVTRSDPNSDIFDKLFFVRFDSPSLVIPSFIKSFSEECFSGTAFEEIEFKPDTQIKSFNATLFAGSFDNTIKIPSSVKTINEHSFCNCVNLKTKIFEPDSKLKKND